MPLQRRLPKFGFKNINRIEYQPVNLSSIQKLAEKQNLTEVGIEELVVKVSVHNPAVGHASA